MKLKSDISETMTAACMVSVRRILSLVSPIVQSTPCLKPITSFQVLENNPDSVLLFLSISIPNFQVSSHGQLVQTYYLKKTYVRSAVIKL